MKKAQSLTLNTMAVAAIVLVVIIITIAVFTGVVGDAVPFFKERSECAKQPGAVTPYCFAPGECGKEGGVEIYGLGCKDDKPYCCIENKVKND